MPRDATYRARSEPLREFRAPRRIVVPVTLAADSIELVGVAAALASALGAELLLAGIAPLARPHADGDSATDLTYDQHLVDLLVRERLEEIAAGLAAGIHVRTVVSWGPVGPALVATAREHDADLAVIAMRREGEWRHLAHDHTDRHVLHHIDVPVLVVPTHAPPPPIA
jgi:nucleotide-binding universal stress UspA family protein